MTRHKDWVVEVFNTETGDQEVYGPYFEDQAVRLTDRVNRRCKNGLYDAMCRPLNKIEPEMLNEWAQFDREGTSVET